MVAQHNALMLRLRPTLLGLLGVPSWRSAEKQRDRSGADLADAHRIARPRRRAAGNLPYGDQRRSKSRARCAPNRRCSASTSRPPG
jgi:ABC-type branched-chain amino acid transport systems, ATPase component